MDSCIGSKPVEVYIGAWKYYVQRNLSIVSQELLHSARDPLVILRAAVSKRERTAAVVPACRPVDETRRTRRILGLIATASRVEPAIIYAVGMLVNEREGMCRDNNLGPFGV